MSSDDILSRIEEEEARSLYKNQRIFAEDYAPRNMSEVKHRDEEMNKIARCIHNATKRVRSELYIYGVAGLGKSYTVRAVLNDTSKRWEKQFRHAWVNCKNISPLTDFQVTNEICEQLGYPFDKRGKGHSTRDIEEVVIARHEEIPLLIVFDEADALIKGKNTERLLYTFFDKGISQILLSNDFGWVENVDPRIKSRSDDNDLIFGVYNADQLKDILWFITLEGLKDGVMSDNILMKIAEHTTNTFLGDVRKAKILMSGSVQSAIKDGADVVTKEHLARAIPRVEPTRLLNMLRSFGKQELCALGGFVIQRIHSDKEHGKNKEVTTENIHYFYERVAKLNDLEHVGSTRMKDFLRRLELSNILEHKLKSYKTRGKTNVYYSVRYSIKELGRALEELKLTGCGDGSLVSFGFFSSKKMLGLTEGEEKWNKHALDKQEEINRKKGISSSVKMFLGG